MTHEDRTIHLNQPSATHDDALGDDILVAALGRFQRARPGQSIRETLRMAGIELPTQHQTLRVNRDEVDDLSRILQPGDKVTIVNRVVGGHGQLIDSIPFLEQPGWTWRTPRPVAGGSCTACNSGTQMWCVYGKANFYDADFYDEFYHLCLACGQVQHHATYSDPDGQAQCPFCGRVCGE